MSKSPDSLPLAGRLVSLDAYRGLIMSTLLMGGLFQSLEHSPDFRWLAIQNEHVAWEGCVYWDLIQPSFMFMVGVAMPFAWARRLELGESLWQRWRHAFTRALGLILLGIVLDHFGAEKIQIGFIRVLQQIAIGYLLAFPWIGRGWRVPVVVAGVILVAYQLVWMFNAWNGPEGPWAQGNANIGSAFDMWLIGRYYSGYYVGLNAIPSTATILFGVAAGEWIRSDRTQHAKVAGLLWAGLIGVLGGYCLGFMFPLIKRIWTPSFAVFAGGWTTWMLLFFYWTIEVKGWKWWTFPSVVVGSNSIAAYVLGNIGGGWFRDLIQVWIGWARAPLGDAWFPVFQHVAVFAVAWSVLWWFYQKRIFFKL